jgi:drug/metabolite transporter (DMT)-like permease
MKQGFPRPTDRPLAAILLINLAVLTFTAMDGIIKFVSAEFPTGELIFCRNLFAFLPILVYALASRQRLVLRTSNPWGHFWRGLFGVGAMSCFFLSYRLLPLSEAVALGMAGPIFLTILSVPILGERVGWRRWSAALVGFAGVLVMTRPGAGMFEIAALIPLLGAVFYALAMISIRQLSASESTLTIVFYFTLFAIVASLASLPLGNLDPDYRWHWPADGQTFALLVLIGLMGGCAQILLTFAFRLGPVSMVAPFDYMALVYAFVIGFFAFAEVPDSYLIIGSIVVVLSGVYIIHRETVVARQRHRKLPVPPLPTNE